jgi:hypothetical protein
MPSPGNCLLKPISNRLTVNKLKKLDITGLRLYNQKVKTGFHMCNVLKNCQLTVPTGTIFTQNKKSLKIIIENILINAYLDRYSTIFIHKGKEKVKDNVKL